jgi:hypothetical protein
VKLLYSVRILEECEKLAKVFNFPTLADREWRVWEEAIRSSSSKTIYDEQVLTEALIFIKEHWTIIFEPVDIESPPKAIPGELSAEQANAIRELIDSNVQLVIERLKHERTVALGRLIQCELTLAYHRLRGVP